MIYLWVYFDMKQTSATFSSQKFKYPDTQLRGKGGDFLQPFFKIEKSVLILEEKAMILSIFLLNFTFKM